MLAVVAVAVAVAAIAATAEVTAQALHLCVAFAAALTTNQAARPSGKKPRQQRPQSGKKAT